MSATSENCRHDRETVDAEHEMQLQLVEALLNSLNHPAQQAETPALMEQLQSFCAAHFMSEELLMRLCAYPDYDDHVADHERTLETLADIAAALHANRALAGEKLAEMKVFLGKHIRSRDAAFTDYYRRWSDVGSDGQAPE